MVCGIPASTWTCPPPDYLNVMGGGSGEKGVRGGKLVVLRAGSLENVGENWLLRNHASSINLTYTSKHIKVSFNASCLSVLSIS